MKIFRLIYYYIIALFKLKDVKNIIFMGYNGNNYNFNSKYLFEYFIKEHPEYNCYFILDNKEQFEKYKKIFPNNIINTSNPENIKLIFNAGTWITSGGLPFRIPYANKKRVVVNLGHGMPLKGLGLDNKENTWLQNLGIKFIYSKYDLLSATSDLFKSILERSYHSKDHQVQIIGNCWDDEVLKIKQVEPVLKTIFTDLPKFEHTILYAPTWRENENTQVFPFKDLDLDKLEQYLEEKQILIFLRLHHLDHHNKERFKSAKRIIALNGDKIEDIMGYLSLFSMLITDYSSILVDYMLLNRPVILLAYDEESYNQNRSLNIPINQYKFYGDLSSQKEFIDTLSSIIANGNKITIKQKKTLELFFLHKDERNCERHFKAIEDLIHHKHGKAL